MSRQLVYTNAFNGSISRQLVYISIPSQLVHTNVFNGSISRQPSIRVKLRSTFFCLGL